MSTLLIFSQILLSYLQLQNYSIFNFDKIKRTSIICKKQTTKQKQYYNSQKKKELRY